MLDFISYESLQKIEPINLITTIQQINENISVDNTPIPSRLDSINLLRSIHKYQPKFFFELFGALKSKFIKNCLNYDKNPRVQKMALYFIREIYDDDTCEIPDDAIYNTFFEVLKFLKNNDNSLREIAVSTIKTFGEKLTCSAKMIALIESLKDPDEKICDFILECFKIGMENIKGFISIIFNFNDIFDTLNLEEVNDQKYYLKIKRIFNILKNYLESNEEVEIYKYLTDKYKAQYQNLIS